MNERIVRMFLATGTAVAMLGVPSLSRAAAPEPPTVIISEVAWAGSSVSTVDEWLELTNLSAADVDIGNWTIDGAATSGGTLTIPEGSVILPYSTFLIANYENDNAKSALNAKPDFVSTSVSLSNAALSLVLADSDGIVHDAAGDGSAPLAGDVGGSGGGYAAMARRSPVSDGTQADAWVTASGSSGFDASIADFGTPGTLEAWFAPTTNEVVEVAIEEPSVDGASTGNPVESVEPPVEQVQTPAMEAATEPETAVADEPVAAEPEIETAVEEPEIATEPMTANEPSVVEPQQTAVEEPIADAAQTPVIETETVATIPETVEIRAVPIAETTGPVDAIETTIAETPTNGFAAGTLRINEFVSDASDEWVELLNASGMDVLLSEWTIADANGKTTALPEQTLGAGQLLVVTNPNGKLNNDGDVIVLLDPTGAVIDEIAYGTEAIPAPKKAESTSRDADGTWKRTTTPTAGAENAYVEADGPAVSEVKNVEDVESVEAATEQSSTTSTSETQPSDSTSPTATASTPTITLSWSGPVTLRLSELYPNTSGDDATEEFIEVENVGDVPVDLRGWQIADASGKTFTAKDETPIPPHAMLALHRNVTKITLNNDDDSVTLTAPNGTVVDTRSYAKAKKGSSFVLLSSEWVWTGTPTPNEPNAVPPNAAAAVAATSGSGVTLTPGTVRHSIEGTVLVAPGVLSSQTFYVATDDGGTQVYKYDGDFPEVHEGDVVRITGTTTTARGEERLKVSKTDAIKVIGSGDPVVAEDLAIGDLSDADVGKLVRVPATVVTRSGDKVTVEDGPNQLTVRVTDGTNIDAATLTRGKKFRITGILTAGAGKLTLLPRSQADIEPVEDPAGATSASVAPTGNQSAASRDAATASAISVGVALLLAAYSARKFGPKFLHWYAKARALRAAA